MLAVNETEKRKGNGKCFMLYGVGRKEKHFVWEEIHQILGYF